jgi:hypothetical protein
MSYSLFLYICLIFSAIIVHVLICFVLLLSCDRYCIIFYIIKSLVYLYVLLVENFTSLTADLCITRSIIRYLEFKTGFNYDQAVCATYGWQYSDVKLRRRKTEFRNKNCAQQKNSLSIRKALILSSRKIKGRCIVFEPFDD